MSLAKPSLPDMSAFAGLQKAVAPPPPAIDPIGLPKKKKQQDMAPTVISASAAPDVSNIGTKTLLGQ